MALKVFETVVLFMPENGEPRILRQPTAVLAEDEAAAEAQAEQTIPADYKTPERIKFVRTCARPFWPSSETTYRARP